MLGVVTREFQFECMERVNSSDKTGDFCSGSTPFGHRQGTRVTSTKGFVVPSGSISKFI